MSKEIGFKLKQERINKKLTVEEVANKLKIRKYYIEVIETGDFRELPGLTYAIGFVKSYAKLVDVDSAPFLEILRNEPLGPNYSKHVGLATPRMESALPSRRVVGYSLLSLLVFYTAWAFFMNSSSEQKKMSQDAPIIIDKIQIEENQTSQEKIEDAVVLPLESDNTKTPDNSLNVEKLEVIETPVIEKRQEPRNYGNLNTEASKIVITVIENAWIQLRNEDEVIFSKELIAGDKYYIFDYNEGLLLDTGNAGGIVLTVEGKDMPKLGKKGAVVRNLVLTEDALESTEKALKQAASN